MKILDVTANPRKRSFEIVTPKKTYSFPYARLRHRIPEGSRVLEVYPDKECGYEAFTYVFDTGHTDTIHIDAVLEYNADPRILNDLFLYRLTVEAQNAVEVTDLSKRELIRQLGTSASQFYRLLDPTNYSKSVGQMISLLYLLGKEVDMHVRDRVDSRPGGPQPSTSRRPERNLRKQA